MRFLSCLILLLLLYVQPLVADGQTNSSIPTDFFGGITLDTTIVVPFPAYKPIPISGTVSDSLVTDVRLFFADDCDVGLCRGLYSYVVPVRESEFRHTLFFSNEQAGVYQFEIRAAREGESFSGSGLFRPLSIQMNEEISPIPVDYFVDIKLSSSFPVEFATGKPIRMEGTVSGPPLTSVILNFKSDQDIPSARFEAPVIDDSFSKTIFFAHKQAGVYRLSLYRVDEHSQRARLQDSFGPIDLTEGEGAAFLPFDYFEEIALTSPISIVLKAGQPLRVTGTVSDNSVSQIEFLFVHARRVEGERPIVIRKSFKENVTNGGFNVNIDFPVDQQPGDYTLYVYLWRRGSSSLGPRIFSPITIEAPRSPDFDGDGAVGFPDFILFAKAFGMSSADENFDARFDLNGDGTVDFGDFLIFAKSFGQ